ncbi:hypothetical protein ACHAXT_012755 [Thalassiosira profunda]
MSSSAAASTDAQTATPQIKGRASPTTTPSPRSGSGRKSPSILARAAMFESGGKARPTSPPTIAEGGVAPRDGALAVGAPDVSSPANEEQGTTPAATTKPTPLKRTTSPPFFPSTRPSPSSSSSTSPIITDTKQSAPAPDTNNSEEATASNPPSPSKLPIAQLLEVENVLRKREDDIHEGELDKLSEGDAESDVDGRSTPGPSGEASGRSTPISGRTTPIGDGSAAGSLASHAMEISDSEPESHAGPMDNDDDQDAAGGDVEWEAFMARYWLSAGTNHVTPAQAAAIVAEEDTDLRPCAMEPELDEKPNALSPIRTGCVDIDMDFSFSHDMDKGSGDDDGLGELGRECSVAVARALESGGLEALQIDVGRMAEASGRRPAKRGQVLEEEVLGPADEHDAPRAVPILREWASPPIEAPSTAGSEAGASAVSSSHTAPLPDPDLVHATGAILTRTSLRSLVMKKWHPGHWMHYGPHALLIFRNSEHLDDWQHNPYHGKKARDFLVKLKIDFWEDMQRDDGGGKEGVLGHRILPVKRKSYGKNEPEMYQFKLERWTNLGCSVIAAFASQEEAEVKVLHDTISKILATCPHNGLRNIDHMLK